MKRFVLALWIFLSCIAVITASPETDAKAAELYASFTQPQTTIKSTHDGFYIVWPNDTWSWPPVTHGAYGEIQIRGPWHGGKENALYATLQTSSREQIEAALAQARETWAASKAVSQTASPKERIWPLPSAGETVDPDLSAAGPLPKGFDLPEGMQRYKRAAYTQKIYTVQGDPRDHIDPVHRLDLDNKDWHQSGGMLGIANFRSDLYRNRVADGDSVTSWIWAIDVKNSIVNPQTGEQFTQPNKARATLFPDGSRFMDVLSNTKSGAVFEIRQRLKEEGKWRNAVIFEDEKERPVGYAGLTKSCTSCHAQAGTGGYAVGLVPGADQTLSIGFKALEK